ncbi:MAG: S8 family serine peptidase, partial [Phycisphaerales bacterium]
MVGLVAVSMLVCVAAGQEEMPADRSSYFYDSAGRVPVAASDSEFLVKMRAARPRGEALRPEVLGARVTPAGFPAAAVRLEDAMERRGLHVVRGPEAARAGELAGVEYALPVLYRPGCEVPIYQTSRVIARFQDGVSEEQIRAWAEAHGCDVERRTRGKNRYLLLVRDVRVTSPLVVANTLHESKRLVEYAHPDFILPKVAYTPPVIDDPYYLSHQWHLDGDVSKGAQPNTDVNVETAWDTDNGPNAQGSPTVRVSIMDECVEKFHPDLYPNWAAGIDLDYIPPDDDPSPDSGERHGTSCAGLAVAKGNTIGVRGAAPDCGLIGVKFFGGTTVETAEGFYFSMDPDDDGDHSDGAAIMSNSWGYVDGTLLPPDVVNAINSVAINGRNGLGCLVLFAAANNDHTVNGVSALAQLPTVMAIGGTNSNGEHTEFSDVGPEVAIATPTNDRGDDGVRLPWLDITTTDNTGTSGYGGLDDPDYTNQFGGTSAATPLAGGVLALIFSQDETMTAAQARAILQHTAVRIDEPYGRFDPVTGHSHRLGFGRADAGAAVVAAHAGMRWPDRIKTLNVAGTGDDITLTWTALVDDYAGSLLVRSSTPFGWMPTDGVTYNVSDEVTPGVTVIYKGAAGLYVDVGANEGGFFYAVYPYSASSLYGFGAKAHLIRNGVTVLYDGCEAADPGWTHGGAGDEWERGIPTSANSIFGQVVTGSGPMAGTRGTRAIGGDRCWGTDMVSTYNAQADAWLQTPLLNLAGVTAPVFLEYYDWCLLETFYDTCTVEVVDPNGNFLGYVDADTGGDYDWTQRVYDLTPYAGQAFKVRWRIQSDELLQRDGWFLDEVRVSVAADVGLPPTAEDVYAETPEDTPLSIGLVGADPNPGTVLDFVITTLPAHGTLQDPNGGDILSAPYTLLLSGSYVDYVPAPAYQGPDSFSYKTNDGALDSNTAAVTLAVGTPALFDEHTLDSDPGWLTEGDWAYGVPQGSGGDPISGYTGPNVYGYNLEGMYPSSLPATYLTMPPVNCTGLTRVTLDFARWLGVEANRYDGASVEVSTDGRAWSTVWRNGTEDLQETDWSLQSYNLSQWADDEPFVQIRWTMGPTDSNTEYSGWNLDDIRLLAIGTPSPNQPPWAQNLSTSTATGYSVDLTLEATDANDDPLEFVIVQLPENGTLIDPAAGPIATTPYTLAAGGNVVTYSPDGAFAGLDVFQYQADDGLLASNVADASVEVLYAAVFPYVNDFEAGPPLDGHWTTRSTGAGRISVTGDYEPQGLYHLIMDSGHEGTYSLNELTLAVDLLGQSMVLLRYDWKDFSEEAHALPDSWTGSAYGDGVAISADGVTWHKIADLFDPAAARSETYQEVLIELDQAAADAGIAYNRAFRIRFQQYDNYPAASDGIAIDNVRVVQGTPDPLITTASLPVARLGEQYGPVQVEASGGDHPLVWSTPIVYSEDDLGTSQF